MENISNDSAVSSADSSNLKKPKKSKKATWGWVIIFGVVLVILILAVLDRVVGINIFTTKEARQQAAVEDFLADTGAWHAVFLTNGQVYFGQLENPEARYAKLKDVYYLQLQQQVQQAGQASPSANSGQEGESQVVSAPVPVPPKLTLIKFGTELHGPKDFMEINRDHILFWEELKTDSQVVKAIVNYKKGQ